MKILSVINRKFIKAAKNNQLDELKNLLSQGADVHTDNDYALRWFARRGHLDTVKFLTARGADIHANNDEALRWSAQYGRLEVVKFLVTHGANIHGEDDYALRYSARNGHLEIIKFLPAKGANIHVNNDEIFKIATRNENEPMLVLLNAFLTEEKLLVAAVGSVALVAASDAIGGASLVNGLPSVDVTLVVLPLVGLKKSQRSKV